MSDVVALRRRKPIVLADLVPGALVRDALLVVGAASLVGLMAQLSFHLSFTPVPITGQTLAVLLSGTALGWRRGAAAMALYAVAGVAGVPWFADHSHGYVGASFGYVVGFVVCAGLCGYLAQRGADRSVWKSVPAMVAGEVMIYLFGVTWLALTLHVGVSKALSLGFVPFVAGDAIKAALAALLLPAAWKVVGTGRGARQR
ncbi:MAG TPA: biotin transporter BioY [Acidimicrobiales bacterium]|nr:biotin transporter BioY [Acidimicrobiales bacterium]